MKHRIKDNLDYLSERAQVIRQEIVDAFNDIDEDLVQGDPYHPETIEVYCTDCEEFCTNVRLYEEGHYTRTYEGDIETSGRYDTILNYSTNVDEEAQHWEFVCDSCGTPFHGEVSTLLNAIFNV